MATAFKIEEPVASALVVPSAELVVAEPSRGDVVLFNREAFDQFEAKLREDLKDFVPDLSTAASRKAIASKAFEVTKVKTTLEKQAKALTEEWRTRTNAVNAGRNVIVGRLEALADEVRRPLTDWEEAEKARVAAIDGMLAELKAHARVDSLDTAAMVRERGQQVWKLTFDPLVYQDRLPEVEQAKADAVTALRAALVRLEREEADRAELARLRAENEAREAAEAEAQRIRDAEARQAEEARRAEEQRIAAEQAEAERIERAKEEAAEAERQRLQREHEEALAAERRRADEAERARQAEADRIAAEEKARREEEEARAEEQRRRDADKAHRTKVMRAAKEAIITCGVDDETAKKIVLLIRAGEVPNVTLRF